MSAPRHDEYGPAASGLYDGVYARVRDPSGDRAFYDRFAADGPVLEIGCGTGRVLGPIAQRGVDATGLDASPNMLEVFARKGTGAKLVQGDMRDFELGRRFPRIYAAFRPFQHLIEVEDQLACLRAVRRHLEPGGLFAFDLFFPLPHVMTVEPTPWRMDAQWEEDGVTVTREARAARRFRAQIVDVEMRYTRGDQVSVESFPLRWFYRFEVEHLLARAGFSVQALYGRFDETVFDEGSSEMIFVVG